MVEAFRVSTRKACRATGVARATILYRARRPSQEPLRRRLRELAQVRVSYGYKRLHVLLRRDGWAVNVKRVYRLDREEGLALARRRRTRRKSAVVRSARAPVTGANERWSGCPAEQGSRTGRWTSWPMRARAVSASASSR